MEAILLKPKDSKEFKLLTDLLNKMNVTAKILSQEDLEDAGLGVMMKEADRSDTVSREAIFQKLNF